jgi:hypothetical protein
VTNLERTENKKEGIKEDRELDIPPAKADKTKIFLASMTSDRLKSDETRQPKTNPNATDTLRRSTLKPEIPQWEAS